MMFMNEIEIRAAAGRFKSDPVMGPATRTLFNLMDAADHNSDGWAYWPKPARAAKQLMELIDTATLNTWATRVEVTADQVRAALRPIKSFRTRSGLDFEIIEPRRES